MLMVYSPGTTEAMFADMTALSEEERADWDTGAAVAAQHNTIWVKDFPYNRVTKPSHQNGPRQKTAWQPPFYENDIPEWRVNVLSRRVALTAAKTVGKA